MYYVPDGTKECGYYECKKCGNRFLSMQTMKRIPCPDCEAEIDYEIGPDESLEDVLDTAELIQKIEGEEEVEKMDTLLSLALTGGDYSWIKYIVFEITIPLTCLRIRLHRSKSLSVARQVDLARTAIT